MPSLHAEAAAAASLETDEKSFNRRTRAGDKSSSIGLFMMMQMGVSAKLIVSCSMFTSCKHKNYLIYLRIMIRLIDRRRNLLLSRQPLAEQSQRKKWKWVVKRHGRLNIHLFLISLHLTDHSHSFSVLSRHRWEWSWERFFIGHLNADSCVRIYVNIDIYIYMYVCMYIKQNGQTCSHWLVVKYRIKWHIDTNKKKKKEKKKNSKWSIIRERMFLD